VSEPSDPRLFQYPRDLPLRHLLRAALLIALVATVAPESHIGRSGSHLGAFILVAIVVASWVGWLVAQDRGRPVVTAGALVVLAAAGGTLAPIAPAAIAFAVVAGVGAAMAFELPLAVMLVAVAPVAQLISASVQHRSLVPVGGCVAAALGGLTIGLARRQAQLRTEQLALVRVERERAELEHDRAELLGERNRLAREIHDVLAHTLGAVSVQIEALDSVVDSQDAEQLHARVQSTRRLVTQGLDEARRAISALRDDAPPLVQQLKELCAGSDAELSTAGEVRPLTPHVSLALFRIAQEALTNAAKHAPGAPVSVSLQFSPGAVSLGVANGRGSGQAAALGASGGGYGLQGMRERVLLLGGTVETGPSGEGWLVVATVPA